MRDRPGTSIVAVQQTVKVLNFTATVFHESRCGSALTANLLVAVDPAGHRVYSESPAPPVQALYQVCGEVYSICSRHVAAAVLQNVVYMMSRSSDHVGIVGTEEQRVFY